MIRQFVHPAVKDVGCVALEGYAAIAGWQTESLGHGFGKNFEGHNSGSRDLCACGKLLNLAAGDWAINPRQLDARPVEDLCGVLFGLDQEVAGYCCVVVGSHRESQPRFGCLGA